MTLGRDAPSVTVCSTRPGSRSSGESRTARSWEGADVAGDTTAFRARTSIDGRRRRYRP